jgi:hypothetical protein
MSVSHGHIWACRSDYRSAAGTSSPVAGSGTPATGGTAGTGGTSESSGTIPRRAPAYLVTDEMVAQIAARHSLVPCGLDNISRNAMLNAPPQATFTTGSTAKLHDTSRDPRPNTGGDLCL